MSNNNESCRACGDTGAPAYQNGLCCSHQCDNCHAYDEGTQLFYEKQGDDEALRLCLSCLAKKGINQGDKRIKEIPNLLVTYEHEESLIQLPICEHCDEHPATQETEEWSLCDICHDEYIDGYRER